LQKYLNHRVLLNAIAQVSCHVKSEIQPVLLGDQRTQVSSTRCAQHQKCMLEQKYDGHMSTAACSRFTVRSPNRHRYIWTKWQLYKANNWMIAREVHLFIYYGSYNTCDKIQECWQMSNIAKSLVTTIQC
jgi:hypothetical protein